MIIVAVNMTILPGKRAEFLERTRVLVECTRKEPGNISYGFYGAADTPDGVLVFEQWKDRQALEDHMNTPHFLEHRKGEPAFLNGEPDVRIFEVAG